MYVCMYVCVVWKVCKVYKKKKMDDEGNSARSYTEYLELLSAYMRVAARWSRMMKAGGLPSALVSLEKWGHVVEMCYVHSRSRERERERERESLWTERGGFSIGKGQGELQEPRYRPGLFLQQLAASCASALPL